MYSVDTSALQTRMSIVSIPMEKIKIVSMLR